MACKSCINSPLAVQILASKQDSDWLTQEEVKSICEPCYENMIKHSISKIKKSVLLEKFKGSKMTFYQLLFKGAENSKLNLAQYTLLPLEPMYLLEEELPLSVKELGKIPNLVLTTVELNNRPTANAVQVVSNKLKGKKGVVWVGASPKRVNEYGTFVKNEINWDVSEEGMNTLSQNSSFKIV